MSLDGCILSTRSLDGKGYPQIWKDGKLLRESRVMLERKLGRPIKPDYCALHTCDNTRCINEEHLWEGTQLENMQDAIDKGKSWGFGAQQRNKTHCPAGHPYSPENTYLYLGYRKCRTCRRLQKRKK